MRLVTLIDVPMRLILKSSLNQRSLNWGHSTPLRFDQNNDYVRVFGLPASASNSAWLSVIGGWQALLRQTTAMADASLWIPGKDGKVSARTGGRFFALTWLVLRRMTLLLTAYPEVAVASSARAAPTSCPITTT